MKRALKDIDADLSEIEETNLALQRKRLLLQQERASNDEVRRREEIQKLIPVDTYHIIPLLFPPGMALTEITKVIQGLTVWRNAAVNEALAQANKQTRRLVSQRSWTDVDDSDPQCRTLKYTRFEYSDGTSETTCTGM